MQEQILGRMFPTQDTGSTHDFHFRHRKVAELNRKTWKHMRAETDDSYEWLPNPNQKGVWQEGIRGVWPTKMTISKKIWKIFLPQNEAASKTIPLEAKRDIETQEIDKLLERYSQFQP